MIRPRTVIWLFVLGLGAHSQLVRAQATGDAPDAGPPAAPAANPSTADPSPTTAQAEPAAASPAPPHSTSTPDDSVDIAASRPQPTSGDSGDSGDSGEPSGEGAVGEPAPPTHDAIYEPPLPEPHFGREPVVLPPPPHIAPRASVWVGARTGWLFPFGSMWQDGTAPSGLCCVYQRRSFDDFASSGPMFELDLGARLSRNYNVFGLWEWALLRDGDELGDAFGGQTSARSHFIGLGLRFSTDPDQLGLLVEMAVGWRQFEATWEYGTKFTATDEFFNTRIGIGADVRLDSRWSVTPMLTLGSGVFGKAKWRLSDGERTGAFSSFLGSPVDEAAQHVPVTLQVAIHYDAFATRD